MAKMTFDEEAMRQNFIIDKMSLTDIALQQNVSIGTLRNFLRSVNINKNNRYSENFNDEQNQILLGTLLGDGNLSIRKSGRAYFRVTHCLKQEELAQLKLNILKEFATNKNLKYYNVLHPITKESLPTVYFQTVRHDLFTKMYNLCYVNNIKTVSLDWLNQVNYQGIAIWIADDGSLQIRNSKPHCLILNTQGFHLEGNIIIQKWFKDNFDIDFKIGKDQHELSVLRCYGDSMRLLISKIKPYMPNCMLYKVGE